jgi:single-strand DNA-binding protein
MAMSLNRVQLIGNLTRDPELKQIPGGQVVASFGIATNRTWKDASGEKQEKADFHNIVVWGKLAEICGQYLKKGGKIFIEGRMQTRDWEGDDGVKRYRTEVVGENMIMLGGRGEVAPMNREAGGIEAVVKDKKPAAAPVKAAADDEVKVDDLPF